MDRAIVDELAKAGLSEYAELLGDAGMTEWADLAEASADDLAAVGVTKLFHRNKLLRLAEANGGTARPAADAASQPQPAPSECPGRHELLHAAPRGFTGWIAGWSCSQCQETNRGKSHGCRVCDFDLCDACFTASPLTVLSAAAAGRATYRQRRRQLVNYIRCKFVAASLSWLV
jgi:hypothetical protein